MTKTAHIVPILITTIFLGVSVAEPREPSDLNTHTAAAGSRHHDPAFGKSQVVSGRIAMTVPQQRLLVLAVRDSRLAAQVVRGTHTDIVQDGRTVSQSDKVTSVDKAPGEASLSFEVNGQTQIKVAGERATFGDLAFLANKRATVRFVPYRNGNVARTIKVAK